MIPCQRHSFYRYYTIDRQKLYDKSMPYATNIIMNPLCECDYRMGFNKEKRTMTVKMTYTIPLCLIEELSDSHLEELQAELLKAQSE